MPLPTPARLPGGPAGSLATGAVSVRNGAKKRGTARRPGDRPPGSTEGQEYNGKREPEVGKPISGARPCRDECSTTG